MRRAFVSHSTADDSYVAEMESFLRAAGFDDVFNDVSTIRPDEQFWPRIERGITECDTFVVVITAAANNSAWVKREVEFARRLGKRVIPVWREDCPLPPEFADRDVIDFRPRTRKERRFDIDRIFKYAPAELIGREDETKLLHDAWQKTLRLEKSRPRVLTFVALGGEGKTSLVAKWAAELAAQDWPGCDAAFAWSFYSQGTREQVAASSDLFLKEALTFFGDDADKAFAASPAGAFEKGQRLARIVGQRRSLLILDGLEPLQYAPTSPTPGQLKDQGIAALLKGLAQNSHGLCVVTTRCSLPDLRAFWQTTAPEVKLLRLSRAAGVHLLKTLGVRGTAQEFETLVEDVKGHALTLQIMGGFLARAFGGDIRQRDRVKFEKADEKIDGGHAFRVLDAYVRWMEGGAPSIARHDGSGVSEPSDARRSNEARRELAILRCLGLFDRPATRDCLEALLQPPAIAGLTEPLVGLSEEDWNLSIAALDSANLVSVNRDEASAIHNSSFIIHHSLDTHPHIREYFAKQLRDGGRAGSPLPAADAPARLDASRRARSDAPYHDAWRAAHQRLYEHLCATTKEGDQPTLEDLQPLYQAVAHGCQAGLQQAVLEKVYHARIKRRDENYSLKRLGLFGSELGVVTCFFEQPWNRVAPALRKTWHGWLLNEAAFTLRSLGRLIESHEPMRAGLKIVAKLKDWRNAAQCASNLSELNLTLGAVAEAVEGAEQSVNYADRSGDGFQRYSKRTTHADALQQAGRRAEAETRFREAEQMLTGQQPARPLLYSLWGFRYCDLLLAAPERVAWQCCLESRLQAAGRGKVQSATASSNALAGSGAPPAKAGTPNEICRAVSQRAAQTLKIAEEYFGRGLGLLDIALDHLTLGRAALYAAILESCRRRGDESQTSSAESQRLLTSSPTFQTARRELDAAVDGLRRAGTQDHLPRGLLTRAWVRFLTGPLTGPDSAQEDLDEAWEIAARGPMRLFLADILLHRARLFGARQKEKGERQKADSAYPWESPAAELADAQRALLGS